MDPPNNLLAPPSKSLPGLGPRLREVRRARGLSQAALVSGHFTKSYVSAVERGRAHPSLRALEVMARRLGVPVTDLLTANPAEDTGPDLPALQAELSATLAEAAELLSRGHAAEAVRRLDAAALSEATAAAPPSLRFRRHLLHAETYLHSGEPTKARAQLSSALTLAGQMGDVAATAQAQDLLGTSFAQQGLMHPAREAHEAARQAIQANPAADPFLRLRIDAHLLADYAALEDIAAAEALYEEAAPLLAGADDLEQQAATYRDLGHDLHTGDPARAQRYADQAQALAALAAHRSNAAGLEIDLAVLLIARRKFPEAARLLERAQALLGADGPTGLRGQSAAAWAALELGRGQRERAAEWAGLSVQLAAAALAALPSAPDPLARTIVLAAYVEALGTAGQVAEAQGQPAEADRLFEQALSLLGPDAGARRAAIELTYADLLAARGDHAGATTYYQAAARNQVRQSP